MSRRSVTFLWLGDIQGTKINTVKGKEKKINLKIINQYDITYRIHVRYSHVDSYLRLQQQHKDSK